MEMTYVSERGGVLPLTSNEYFHLIDVDGQTSAASSLSSVEMSGADGDTVTEARVQPRSIVLDLRVKMGVDVEEAKRELLKVVKPKTRGSLEWTQNERTVRISGIVESIDMPRWNNAVNVQVTLHCDQPFWEDINEAVKHISEFIDLHYFTDSPDDMLYFPDDGIPFGEYDLSRTRDIYNFGDVSVGIEIEIIAYETVTNPIIYDMENNFFGVGFGDGQKKVTMQSGDIITITTGKGNKTVKLNGNSLFGKIKANSTWLQLAPGENTFSIDSDEHNERNMKFHISYRQRYV